MRVSGRVFAVYFVRFPRGNKPTLGQRYGKTLQTPENSGETWKTFENWLVGQMNGHSLTLTFLKLCEITQSPDGGWVWNSIG